MTDHLERCAESTGIRSGATVQYSTDGGTAWTKQLQCGRRVEHGEVRQTDVAGEPDEFGWGR